MNVSMTQSADKASITLESLQIKAAAIDLQLKEAELRNKTSIIAWAKSPATLIAVVALILPLWIGHLNNEGLQAAEIRKLESEIINKTMQQSTDLDSLRNNMHNLLKVGLVKQQKEAVCNFLRTRGGEVDRNYC